MQTDSRNALIRELGEHFLEQGRFGPFTYSIGLESSLADALDSVQPYPLPEPVDEERIRQFLRSLTFYHECAHLCQFLSTGYGLRTLRYTLVCLRNLSRRPGWELPIGAHVHEFVAARDPDRVRAAEGFVNLLDVMDQLRLHASRDARTDGADAVGMYILPWSPHFFLLGDQFEESRIRYAEHLRRIGVHVRGLPVMRFTRAEYSYDIVLNVATLMESYAILVELNHIVNALGRTAEAVAVALDLVPQGNEYHAVIEYFLRNGCGGDGPTQLLALSVCIDAALMYDPFVLFNVPWDVPDRSGRAEQYPGETFLALGEAAKHVEPIRAWTPGETSRFYRAVCRRAGIPDPEWMAEKSYEVAAALDAKEPSPDVLMGRALKAHVAALRYRVEKGAAAFPFYLPTSDCLFDLLALAAPAVTFYNLKTRKPERFDPRNVDTVTIHSLLLQAFAERSIDCPLKYGDPFYCESGDAGPNELCVWLHEHGRSECLVDVLERVLGLVRLRD